LGDTGRYGGTSYLTVGKSSNSKRRKIKANVHVKEKEMAIKLMKIGSTFHKDEGKLERYSQIRNKFSHRLLAV
jgi:hypothetical protein